jgi:hypothetical protein
MPETGNAVGTQGSDERFERAALIVSRMNPPLDGQAVIQVPGNGSVTIREVLDWAAGDRAKQVLEADVRANLVQLAAH